jgi:cell division inhibitor SulA/protein ImuA
MKLDDSNLLVWRGKGMHRPRQGLATGYRALDEFLPDGGWPRGALTELLIEHYGIGELALLVPALASLTRPNPARHTRKWVTWIAPPFVPYAPALQQRGIALDSVLLIHPTAGVKNRLWAVEQVVKSGTSSAVLAWLAAADDVALRRLQLVAEQHDCWVVLFRPASARNERSPAALRIGIDQHGSITRLHVRKCRGGRPGILDLEGLLWRSDGVAECSEPSSSAKAEHCEVGAEQSIVEAAE